MCQVCSELAAVQESYSKAYSKLLNGCGYYQKKDGIQGTTRLNWAKKTLREVVEADGGSFQAAMALYVETDRAIARLHATTGSRMAQSICVILSQTQDELMGAKPYLFSSYNTVVRTLFKRWAKTANKLSDDALGSRGEQSIEGNLVDDLESSGLESLQMQLRTLELGRQSKTKVALLELYQALQMQWLGSQEEEESRKSHIEIVDVRGDIESFIKSTVEGLPVQVKDSSTAALVEYAGEIQYGSVVVGQLEVLSKLAHDDDKIASTTTKRSASSRRVKSDSSMSMMIPAQPSNVSSEDTSNYIRSGSLRRSSEASVAKIEMEESQGEVDDEDVVDESNSPCCLTTGQSPVILDSSTESPRITRVLPDLTSPRIFTVGQAYLEGDDVDSSSLVTVPLSEENSRVEGDTGTTIKTESYDGAPSSAALAIKEDDRYVFMPLCW